MTKGASGRLTTLVTASAAAAASVAVLAAYLVSATALVAYPWDWSPDEGLYLDHARRLLEAPATLHARSFVPFPSVYGPVLPLLLAPAVAGTGRALLLARLVAAGWTLAITASVYLLARKRVPRLLALAAVALSLVPFDLTFWHMLLRPDGPMLALLLLAAVALVPTTLTRGSERLSAPRIVAGTTLLVAAVLAKATAVVLAAPLVLGWFVVDRRSGARLTLALGASGLAALGVMQWLTGGGFLWVNRVWGYHSITPQLPLVVLGDFLGPAWPLVAVWLATLVTAPHRWETLCDGSTLLLLGVVLVLPLTTKYGASWSYLVPAIPFLAVATARAWADGRAPLGLPPATAGAALIAATAFALAVARPFPVPTPEDERTARTFYAYVADTARHGPILAMRPEFAYFHVGQPVEMEGSGFVDLDRAKAPGSELVEQRLSRAHYSLVIWTWPLPDTGSYLESTRRFYTPAGGCKLGYYFGAVTATLLPRNDLFRPMLPQAGTRCGSAPAETRPL